MTIEMKTALENMIACWQQQDDGELGYTLSRENESFAVSIENGRVADVSYSRENGKVVLHGNEEALVACPEGQLYFAFDPASGRVAKSLFVRSDGKVGEIEEAVLRQCLRTVEGARIYCRQALARLDTFRVDDIFSGMG